MKTISNTDLRLLVDQSNDPCLSLYMPTYTGAESHQNPARLKKLMRKAEDGLRDHGVEKSLAQELLAPANHLLKNFSHGEEMGQAVGILAGSRECGLYRVDVPCNEVCIVGSHFYILPLVTSIAENAPFYVFAVSQNQLRLLHGSRVEIEEISVPNLPAHMEEALHLDPRGRTLQAYQARTDLQKNKEGLVFHGHGGEPDAAEDEIVAYFHEIERALGPALRDSTEPLVFAGVEYLFPVFREVSQYLYLMPTPIIGNPELLSATDLRQRAWSIVEPTLDERRQEALSRHGDCIGQDRTANSIEEVLIAASAGAVETLFIDPAVKRTGTFDPEHLAVHVDDTPQEDNEDLVNLAATIVLRNSGMVMPLSSATIPGGGEMAATLRYAFPPPIEQMSAATQTRQRR